MSTIVLIWLIHILLTFDEFVNENIDSNTKYKKKYEILALTVLLYFLPIARF